MPPCNGHKHPWNCTCKFGGTSSNTAKRLPAPQTPDLFSVPHVPRHYTKPQIRCPFCNEPVFYCRLSNEGSAYFDKIGHPWPKHPCTDKSSKLYRGPPDSPEENWPRFEKIVVESITETLLRLSGETQNSEFIVFLHRDTLKEETDPAKYICASRMQAKRYHDGRVDLALVDSEFRIVLITGHINPENALLEKPRGEA